MDMSGFDVKFVSFGIRLPKGCDESIGNIGLHWRDSGQSIKTCRLLAGQLLQKFRSANLVDIRLDQPFVSSEGAQLRFWIKGERFVVSFGFGTSLDPERARAVLEEAGFPARESEN